MWKHLVKIQNSQLSIDQMYPSIDRNYEENFNKHSRWLDQFSIGRKIEDIHHKASGWFDRFLIPVWSIEK